MCVERETWTVQGQGDDGPRNVPTGTRRKGLGLKSVGGRRVVLLEWCMCTSVLRPVRQRSKILGCLTASGTKEGSMKRTLTSQQEKNKMPNMTTSTRTFSFVVLRRRSTTINDDDRRQHKKRLTDDQILFPITMFSIRSVFVALLVVSGVVQKQQQQQQQGGTACGMVTAFIMPATNAVARTTQDQWRSFSSLVPIKPSFLHNGRTAIRATDNGIGADEGQGSSDNDDQDSIPLLPPVGQSSSKVSAMDVNDSSKLPNVLSKRFEIQYTCKRCDTRNSHKISRKGVCVYSLFP